VIGTVVLAAGGATRFGSPKLLAEWWGRPLVEWALRSAPDDGPRVAVVGRETVKLRPLFARYGFAVVRNSRPSSGLASSLRTGLDRMPEAVEAALVLLGDSPDIPTAVIERLRTAYRRENGTVAAAYDGVRGHPVILPRAVWDEVPRTGDRAGAVLHATLEECSDLAPGSADVDTPDDLFALAARRSNAELLRVSEPAAVEERLADPSQFAVRADDAGSLDVGTLREAALRHGRMIQVIARVGTEYEALVG
jgi:CTP:molybdopterin cytidylyltransferase MocA